MGSRSKRALHRKNTERIEGLNALKIQIFFFSNKLKSHELAWISEFEKRIKKYCSFELIQKKDDPKAVNDLLASIQTKKDHHWVMLDEHGKKMSTLDFANWMVAKKNSSLKQMNFIIGGSFGLTKEQLLKAHTCLSLSSFTFPHRLALLCLSEQIYRVLSLNAGHPYHHA